MNVDYQALGHYILRGSGANHSKKAVLTTGDEEFESLKNEAGFKKTCLSCSFNHSLSGLPVAGEGWLTLWLFF